MSGWRRTLGALGYGLRVGLPRTAGIYGASVVLFAVLCWAMVLKASQLPIDGQPRWIDYALNAYAGIRTPVPGAVIAVPMAWLLPQLLLCLIVASSPFRSVSSQGLQVLLRAGSRLSWWTAMWGWTLLGVLGFYLGAVLVWCVFGLFTGGLCGVPQDFLELALNGLNVAGLSPGQVQLALLACVATSLALAMVQIVLSVLIHPLAAFVAAVAYYIVSTLVTTKWLVGDHAMVARNKLFDEHGTSSATMLLVAASIAVVALVIGFLAFRRRSILPRE